MRIFGKSLSEYAGFCKPFLILIPALGILRLAMSVGGVPNSTTRWFSMNAALWVGVFYCAIRVHTRGFGGFRHLLPPLVLMGAAFQVVAVAGIAIAIFTGTDNIFSTPEYAFGQDGKTWTHLVSHLAVGIPIGSLVTWVVGCLILFVTKRVARGGHEVSSGSGEHRVDARGYR